MRRVARLLVVASVMAALVLVTIAPAGAAPAQRADIPIKAVGAILTGAEEVPGPGDPDGFGAAGMLINTRTGRICFALFVKHVDDVTAAHIHRGGPGVAGAIAVPLVPAPTTGFSAGCVVADPVTVAGEIAATPGAFYVNVHSVLNPAGAVRGQLHGR